MKNKSFTLIELLVVIVIIGILAGVIIVSVSSSINKANFTKAQSFSNTVQNELLGDLVSEWTFNSPAVSEKTEDSWGNNDGTLMGANGLPQIQTKENCVYGTCYLFDGVDDYIDCGSSNFTITNKATISFWFKSTSNTGKTILSKGWNQWRFYANPLRIYNTRNGIYSEWATNWTYQDNTWYNVVWTNAETQEILYVNGVLKNLRNVSGEIVSSSVLKIGTYDIQYFNGSIDDVRIYNAALSTSQIKQQYVAGLDSLLVNNNISKEEYDQRLNSLAYTD